MNFEKICMMFTVKEPFYGIFLSSMVKRPDKSCGTLGVGLSGALFELVYNPDFVDSCTEDELMEILKHETLHVAFDSFSVFEDKETEPSYKYLQNIASDMEINCYINSDALSRLNPVLPSLYGWDKRLGSREYYKKLLEIHHNQQHDDKTSKSHISTSQSTNFDKLGSTGSSKSAKEFPDKSDRLNTLDTHDMWPNPNNTSESKLEIVKNMSEELLLLAADEVDKKRGCIPAGLQKRIDELRKRKKVKPVADWKRYIRRYLGREFTESTKRSQRRPSKRFPDALGKRKLRKSSFLIAVDTSGSVSMSEYLEFFSQIRTASLSASLHIVECDAKIQYEYDYSGTPNTTLHGFGGTDFQPVIDKFIAERKRYDALIYLTDGYADIPVNTPPEVLWVISSNGNHNINRYRVNGASVVFIPENKKENK